MHKSIKRNSHCNISPVKEFQFSILIISQIFKLYCKLYYKLYCKCKHNYFNWTCISMKLCAIKVISYTTNVKIVHQHTRVLYVFNVAQHWSNIRLFIGSLTSRMFKISSLCLVIWFFPPQLIISFKTLDA